MEGVIRSLGNTPDACFAVDRCQRTVFWNVAIGELLSVRAADVLGRYCYRVLNVADEHGRSFCRRRCQSCRLARRGRLVPTRRVAVRTADGSRITLDLMTVVVPDGERAPYLVHYLRPAGSAAPTPEVRPIDGTRETPPTRLTPRELEVLALLAQGATTAAMADTLTVSLATARNHVQHIVEKLHAHSRLEAVAVARRHGILAAS